MTDLDSALASLRTPQANGVAVLSEPQRLALLAHVAELEAEAEVDGRPQYEHEAMTDDIMTRVREWLASCVRVAMENGVPEEADLEAAALAHLDGEPARLAAAREEQREACRVRVKEWWYSDDGLLELDEHIAATPLTATPLADEIAALRARVAELERDVLALTGPVSPEMLERLSDVQGYVRSGELALERHAAYGAELRARVAELEAEAECQVDGRPQCKAPNHCHACQIALERSAVAQMRAERDYTRIERDDVVKALRGVVETAVASDPHDYVSRAEIDAATEAERRADEVLAKYPEGT